MNLLIQHSPDQLNCILQSIVGTVDTQIIILRFSPFLTGIKFIIFLMLLIHLLQKTYCLFQIHITDIHNMLYTNLEGSTDKQADMRNVIILKNRVCAASHDHTVFTLCQFTDQITHIEKYGILLRKSVITVKFPEPGFQICMFFLSVGAKIAGRIYDMPTGMAAAAILILMENPAYLLDGGFLLSFGWVIGIGCVWPLVQEGMDVLNRKKRSKVNEKGKIRNKLLMSFLESGVVQLTTLP